jgi:hypothetical protein
MRCFHSFILGMFCSSFRCVKHVFIFLHDSILLLALAVQKRLKEELIGWDVYTFLLEQNYHINQQATQYLPNIALRW